LANSNWNPNNRGLKKVQSETTAIANSQSGIVQVTMALNNVRHAEAEYDGKGASGAAGVQVKYKSGPIVAVEFLVHSGELSSGSFSKWGVPAASGYGFSGGTLTIWADGD
jgi:hypothetical protein